MAAKADAKPLVPLPLLIVAGLAAVVGTGAVLWKQLAPPSGEPAAISAEGKAYTKFLQLSDVEMKATASYLSQEVVEITGKIANNGERPLRQVDLRCVFYDTMAQVCLRERVSIVRPKDGVLKPGESRTFRLAFDNIPQPWNKTMPQLVIAQVLF